MTAYLPHELKPGLDLANLPSWNPEALLGANMVTMWNPDGLIQQYLDALKRVQFDPALDFIVMTGRAVYTALLLLALTRYMREVYPDDTGFCVLLYDAHQEQYRPTRISCATIT